MARKDILSDVLREYVVSVGTEFGTSNVKLRATSEKDAAETVLVAITTKYPGIDFKVVKVRTIQDRPLPETKK